MKINATQLLAVTLFISGIWNIVAGFVFLTQVGTGRSISNPEIHPFFSIFLAIFLFSFAYLQLLSSLNIKRYVFNIGCVIIGRSLYILTLCAFVIFVKNFPSTFNLTALVDAGFVALYFIFTYYSIELKIRDLFIPKIEKDL